MHTKKEHCWGLLSLLYRQRHNHIKSEFGGLILITNFHASFKKVCDSLCCSFIYFSILSSKYKCQLLGINTKIDLTTENCYISDAVT